jgi:hypothetical protein
MFPSFSPSTNPPMPSSPHKAAQAWLAAIAMAVLLTGVVGWRTLSAVSATAAPPPATSDLESLKKFLTPISDSTIPVSALGSPPLISHDPFGTTPAAVATFVATTADTTPVAKPVAGPWVVNAVMITGSYRAAIINDALVTLGNKLSDGTRLTAVERDHVVLTDTQGMKRIITVRDGNN